MKIELRKIPLQKKEFETSFKEVVLKGIFYKESQHLVKIESTLNGKVEVECIKCAIPFIREVDENLKLIITDKAYNGFDKEFDAVEIKNQIIDFDDIITSEIESIKLDFTNICDNCTDEFNLEI